MPGAARYSQARAKLADCERHGAGSGAELILVEGDSAQDSVLAVRDARTQAVLPLQGKPLNAWGRRRDKVEQHVLFQQLAQALGLPSPTALPAGGMAALRYERIVLLFDPDADGIHIGALVQLYFARWLPEMVEAGLLCLCRAPMYELVDVDGVVHHALTPDHRQRIEQSLRDDGGCAAADGARVARHRRFCAGDLAPPVRRSGHAPGAHPDAGRRAARR